MDIQIIQNKIYEIRGQRVMLDRDLAELYQVTTGALNQAVKRNVARFPSDFMFQLTDAETENWKSQIVITNSITMGLRRNPYAFTEQGVSMLSAVLKSPIAIQTSIAIMRAFVAIRQFITALPGDRIGQIEAQIKELKDYINDAFADYNDINEDTRVQLELINQALAELQAHKKLCSRPRKPVAGFIKSKG